MISRFFTSISIGLILLLLLTSCSKQENLITKNNHSNQTSIEQNPIDTQSLPEQPDDIRADILAVIGDYTLVSRHDEKDILILKGSEYIEESSLGADHPVLMILDELKRSGHSSIGMITHQTKSYFTRVSDTSGHVVIDGDDISLLTKSVSTGYLADAWLLKKNNTGYWIQQNELKSIETKYKGETIYRLKTIASLRLFNTNGEFISQTSVALRKPRSSNHYFNITNENHAVFLGQNKETGNFESRQLHLPDPSSLQAPRSEIDLMPIEEDASLESFESLIRSQENHTSLQIQRTTRANIIRQAEAILNANWKLNTNNFANSRLNKCNHPSSIWLRPKKLSNSEIGNNISAPPYKWGGNQSLESYLSKIENGAIAGDVCTCRCKKGAACTLQDWCIDPSTVGFDCSGFVSNAWSIPYHSTTTLHKVATPIRWQDLKAGDILNSPGKHVRLFTKFVDGDTLAFEAIESSVGCSGLCRKEFSVNELTGYIPYRHHNLHDDI